MNDSEKWVYGALLYFKDGPDPELHVIQLGSRDECEAAAKRAPVFGVSYSGERPIDHGELVVAPYPDVQARWLREGF